MISCTEDDVTTLESELVVEGWIENDKYPIVLLTQTLPINSEGANINNLQDYLVRWAKVSIICNSDTVVLTGKYDKGYFPPYIYTTSKMKGKTGSTYKLIVEYKDKFATATTTIPSEASVDTYKVEKCVDADTLYQISASMSKDGLENHYYQFFTKIGTISKQYFASFMGNVDESVCDENFEVPIYMGHNNTSSSDYTPYFSINDTVAIKCCNIDKQKYEFWTRYIETQYLSGAAMLSVSNNLPSNIEGGIGYWFGYGSTISYFIIKDYVK